MPPLVTPSNLSLPSLPVSCLEDVLFALNDALATSALTFDRAVVKCEIRVVQSSLLGSILSNLLLVLGMCFFAGE